jgi:hypothetical protein
MERTAAARVGAAAFWIVAGSIHFGCLFKGSSVS